MRTRLLKIWLSNPPSYSNDRSGRRSAFPVRFAARAGVSVPDVEPFARLGRFWLPAVNVTSASVRPGCTPLAPYAVRNRNEFKKLGLGKKDSSEISHDRLAFGYTTFWNFVPN